MTSLSQNKNAIESTRTSFADKWRYNPDLTFGATLSEGSEIQKWILGRNGFQSLAHFAQFLKGKRRILDAGCGNGRVTALIALNAAPDATIVGVDFSSAPVARANLAGYGNVHVEAGDLLGDLGGLGKFDFIYCQEVLHHTADPPRAFANLAKLLAPAGEIAIYVYKLKATVREFTDEFVRQRLSSLPYEEAMAAACTITELGRQLHRAAGSITVPAVDVLGIGAGTYSIQRFVYHFFMKCFWNDELSFEENVAINYDWYHPQTASKHTLPEVRDWFGKAGLAIVHEHVDEYGITVRALAPSA